MRRLTVAIVLAGVAIAAPAAQAAPESCLDPMPVSEVAEASSAPDGLAANGLTVSRGNAPERFEAKVLGVLEDGIAPGLDMIVVEADSAAIDHARGIWAGMSGSPVYANADGRLIGAVAYGLASGASKIGGLAAAEDMADLLALDAPDVKKTVRLPRALRRAVAATDDATAREAAAGLERLRIPLGVSGLSADRVADLAGRLPDGARYVPHSAGAATGAAGDPADIVPGGNFAAALSYGDVTEAGVGTTTAVCGDQVLAFGHPMNFDGPTALSAHTATAITIQDDPLGVPYKLANIGGAVGTIDQDRASGIRALMGAAPAPIRVTSRVESAAAARDGLTIVNRSADVPEIAPVHALANLDRVLDRIGGGSSRVGFTVTGLVDGEQFALSRNNRFADREDISDASTTELADQLGALVENAFAEVSISDVRLDASVEDYRAAQIIGLESRNGDEWVPVDPDEGLTAAPGAALDMRILFGADRGQEAPAPVEVSVDIPDEAAGLEGNLEVVGGPGDEEEEVAAAEPDSFHDLLASLRDAPRNDEASMELQLADDAGQQLPIAPVKQRLDQVISGAVSAPVVVEDDE